MAARMVGGRVVKIVIDVGCAKYGGDESIPVLIETFQPELLFGFDPSPSIDEEPRVETISNCLVVRMRTAAWTFDGEVGFAPGTLGGHIDPGSPTVPCVDLAGFILAIADNHSIVLKMDCEGAEYELVPHLRAHDADLRLALAEIEWHCAACGYGIWNADAPHPGDGCTADPVEWKRRRDETEALLRCNTLGWNL